MHFRILGPIEITGKEYSITPQAPKLRSVLAILLLNHNQTVGTDTLIDELWPERPPTSCHTTLQTYVYQLRKIFAGEAADGEPVANIVTRPSGYAIELDPGMFDMYVFERLAERGNAHLEAGDAQRAADTLREALALWRDVALADVQHGLLLEAHSVRLEEERLRTTESRIEADLQLARHRTVTSELRSLTIRHPLHESFHAKLMLSLYRSGRQNEALQTYRRLRDTLNRELGIDPSTDLQRLQRAILAADAALDTTSRQATTVTGPIAVPAQLPTDTNDFTGRAEELETISGWVADSARPRSAAVPVALISGGLGTGKTAFAVHASHAIRRHYPDGQLFADLRGSTRCPADPAQLLAELLSALGVRGTDLPPSTDERSRLYRSLVSDRRILVVLDDARSAEQVAPLLPGSPDSAVLITSRSRLPDLPRTISLELRQLPVDTAIDMLAAIVDDDRVAGRPDALRSLVATFGRLPLALRAVGTKLRACRSHSLPEAVCRPAARRHPLAELRVRDYDVRTVLDEAYTQLDDRCREALHGLAAVEPETPSRSGASPGGATDLQSTLDTLEDMGLVHRANPTASGGPRFEVPELIRLFAREKRDVIALIDSPAPGELAS